MCPQYTDAPAVGYLTKCLNLSLTGSRTYMYVHTFAQNAFVRMYEKPKNYMPPASSDTSTVIISDWI